ncbi:MAG TPA: transglycosylase SLT domain-containing protein [Burkholderiaceae bacterium]|nr:transglycosylase SLT domain-containing protein [Burkholderiaceae bacterium]
MARLPSTQASNSAPNAEAETQADTRLPAPPQLSDLPIWQHALIWLVLVALAVAGAVVLVALLTPRAHAQTPTQTVPQAAHRYRADLTRAAHLHWGLDAPIAALAAQVHQESGWNPQAVSAVGARGLAQFMPATATWWCARQGIIPAACAPHNPVWALRALVGYDKWLYDRVPGYVLDRHDRLWLALRGYNGGEGHWQAEGRSTGLAQPTRAQIDAACGQARRARVHCAENLAYPRRILLDLQPRYAAWGAAWGPGS